MRRSNFIPQGKITQPAAKWGEKSSSGSKQAMFSPTAGITAGDIGPKMNFEHADNGYLMLQNVRVPRENMLNKFCEVRTDSHHQHTLQIVITQPETTGICLNLGQKSSSEVSTSLSSFIRGRSYLNPKWNSMSGIPRSEVGDHGAGRSWVRSSKSLSLQMGTFHPSLTKIFRFAFSEGFWCPFYSTHRDYTTILVLNYWRRQHLTSSLCSRFSRTAPI